MLITCQKCGFENQQGTLFCKNCGTKLDLDHIDEMIQKRNNGINLKNKFKSFFRLILALVIILILYVIFAVVYPTFSPLKVFKLTKEQQSEATLKLRALDLKRADSYKFSIDEINVLYNKNFISKKLRENPLVITIDNENNFVFRVRKPPHDKIPFDLDFIIVGKPSYKMNKGKSSINDIEIKRVKIGYLTVPKMFQAYILEMFKPYSTKKLKRTLLKISNTEVNEDQDVEIFIVPKSKQ